MSRPRITTQRPHSRGFRAKAPHHGRQPRLARWLLIGLLVVTSLAGCGRSPVERLIDESVTHLEAANAMMVEHKGSIEKLGIAVVKYRLKHRGEFRRLRVEGEKALKALSDEERKTVTERARKRTLALTQSLERASKAYKDPRMAMRLVRPLMVTATARGLAKGQRPPWMPKQLPDRAGSGGHAGHNHGPRPGGGHGLPALSTSTHRP